tara:strand:+ start:7162 stop:7983 length:822 start_codon:yes stop_codon:yes gene_type:complete
MAKKTKKIKEGSKVKKTKKKVVVGDKFDMQIKLLKDVVRDVAGEEAEKIVDLLFRKRNVNEFLIAKKLDLTINQTRNILYKLGDSGLVSFIRKKDSKKGGWYTYFWTLDAHKSLELLQNQVGDKIDKITEDIGKRKKERFYYSPGADIEYNEEDALENDFICPETGEVMELKDNNELISELEEARSRLRELFGQTKGEMEIIEKKELRAKERRLKEEARKKEEERKKRRKKLARERKREAKKQGTWKEKVKKVKKKVKKVKKKKKRNIKKKKK